ncbi:hypothetical protein MTO96_009279 [Rhipicephalus appendiculatus]
MAREGPTTVPLKEKEPTTLEAEVPSTKQERPPPGYEVELPYAKDLTTWTPHEEAPKEKVEKAQALEFEAPQHTEVAHRQAVEEGALQAVRPAGVLYVEPPSYELVYLYVPEFMSREEPTSVPVREKEPVTHEVAVTAIKQARQPPGYEVEFPYAPDLTYKKPHVEALERDKTQPLQVSKPELAEHVKSLQAVRPPGVLYVEPPSYELEYLYVPEFMATQTTTSVPGKGKETMGMEAAVPTVPQVTSHAGYEVDFPNAPDIISRRPHVEPPVKEGTEKTEVFKFEVPEHAKVHASSHEMEYKYTRRIMTHGNLSSVVVQRNVVKEGALQAVRPAGVLYVEPPSYELEYVYVPDFMAREGPTTVPLKEKEPITLEAAVPLSQQERPPPGYEVELPYAKDLTTWIPHEEAPKMEKVEKAQALEFEAPKHTEVAHRQAVEEGALQAVRPAGVLYVEPPSYERVYLYVPEFMTRQEPTSVPVKEKEPITHEVAVRSIKHPRPPPGYEVEFPYALDQSFRKPRIEAVERNKTQPLEVSKTEMAENEKVQPPSYELEYRYIPDYMTRDPSGAAIPQAAQEGALQALRPADVVYVKPPPYELEYVYVPEFMAREGPTTVPLKEKEPISLEAAVPSTKQERPPPGYEVELPYAKDLTTWTPHEEAPKEKVEKAQALEFEAPQHTEVAHRQAVEEGALQAVRPAGVLYVEPPSYELVYLYVPEFMSREEPTSVPVREKEPVTHEVAVTAIKQARQPPGYEVEFPYAPDLTYKKPHVEALERDKTQPLQVSKPELAEHVKSLQAVRPPGVLYVEPPSYELEYLYVPEFMATQTTTSVPEKGKETMGMEAAVPTVPQVTSHAGYEVDFPNAPDIISRRPHVEPPVKEGTEKTEVFKFEVPEHAEVHAPGYEMEYRYTRQFISHGNIPSVVVQRHVVKEQALQAVRAAGVLNVEPPSYEQEYLYVPEFMSREGPTTVPINEKEPITIEDAMPSTRQVRPPPGYEVELPYAEDLTTWTPHEEAPRKEKVEKAQALEFEAPQHTEVAHGMPVEKGALQAVRPAGVLYVEPPSYELVYLYVPEFMAREEPTSASVRQKEPVAQEAAVTAVKYARPPPGYEVDFPYAPDQPFRKPRVEALERDKTQPLEVSKTEMGEYAKVQPPSYELEYMYIPDFMTLGSSGAAIHQVAQDGALQAVRPAGVVYIKPPPYELEYFYVPEFMAREGPSTVPLGEKEPITLEAAVPSTLQVRPPPGYEDELPYAKDLTTWTPHEEAPKEKKAEKAEALEFEAPQHTEVAHRQTVEEGALQAVRPAGVLYVEPPSYELVYLYVPEFMAREEPTSVHEKENEPVTHEVAVTAIKQTSPPLGYEVEFPYAPDQSFRKPRVEALERDKTQPLEVSKTEMAKYAKVQPPSYELEYRYIPDFMTREPSGAAIQQVAQEGALQAVRPAGVVYVKPPPYELEYVYVPEFMAREGPTTVPLSEKEPMTQEAAASPTKQVRPPPGYEVELPCAPDLTTSRPHEAAAKKEKVEKAEALEFEAPQHTEVAHGQAVEKGALQAVRPAGVPYVEPPSYELEYLYVPEFMATQRTTSAPVNGKETMASEAAVPTEQQVTSPTGYEVDFPNVPDIISRRPHAERPLKEGTQKTEVFKFEVPEHAEVHAPSYEVKYKYTRRMMPHGNLSSVVVQRHVVKEGALQAVRPAGVLYVEPPSYELEYLYVPEFIAREEPRSVPVKDNEPVTLEAAVTAIKQARPPPGYEVDFPYAPDQSFRKPRVQAHETDKTQPLEVSKTEMPEYAKVQPPSYELEYRYIPDFMTREPSGAAIPQAAQEGALQAVRPAGVVYVKPPPYELEYVYVPEFMAREGPTTVPLSEKEPMTQEAAASPTKQVRPPPGYEVELPYEKDLTTSRPHEAAAKKEKVEKAEALEFEAPQHTEVTHGQAVEKGALQAVRPAGVLYVEPPSYELVYLYVPEFMAREEPTSFPKKEKEPVAQEAAVMATKQARPPPGYEVDFPYAPDQSFRKPRVQALETDKTQPLEVSKTEMPEYAKVQPPNYELEYRYIPDFMTHEPSGAPPRQVAQEGALQAVRPAGVVMVKPPPYELEYVYVPEFMAREGPTTVPLSEKERITLEATVSSKPQVRQPPGYEVELAYAKDLTTSRPHEEAAEKENLEKAEALEFEAPQHTEVAQGQEVEKRALQVVRPAGVHYVEPPSYELVYLYVPEFMRTDVTTSVPIKGKETMARETAVPTVHHETPPPGYEVDFPNAPAIISRRHHVEPPVKEGTKQTEVFKFEVPEHAEIHAPGYEMEYRYTRQFISHGNLPSVVVQRHVVKEQALQAVRAAGVLNVEPPSYEREYLYVPEFMAREGPTTVPINEKEPMTQEAAASPTKQVRPPPGYEVELPYAPDLTTSRPHEAAAKEKVEKAEALEFEAPQHTEVAHGQAVEKGALQAVRPAGVLYVEPPSYELVYLYVPEFMAREEPTSVSVKEKEPAAQEAGVTAIKHARPPPGYEVDFPYALDQPFRKPRVEALERDKTQPLEISKTEMGEYAKVQPPSYELEYRYIPDFMTHEPSGAPIRQEAQEGALQAVRPAGVVYVKPPPYELEYVYVPEFMAREVPTTVPLSEKQPITLEAAVPSTLQVRPPLGFEVELPYAQDLSTWTPHEEAHRKEKVEKTQALEFQAPQHTQVAHGQAVEERAVQAVRPAGVLYVEPPSYELVYLYVPEFMAREEPTSVSVKEKEPAAQEAAVTAIKQARPPPGYEVDFPYAPDQSFRKPRVEALERDKTQPLEVSKTEMAECVKVQPPSYELEYRYIPDFMTREPSGAAIHQVAQEGALQAVRPAGVVYVKPPPYELEYVYVPEFMAREGPSTVPLSEKEPMTLEAAVSPTKQVRPLTGYEVELPCAPDLTTSRPHEAAAKKEKVEKAEALEFEAPQHTEVAHGQAVEKGALQAVRPAGVLYVEPPSYELVYLYVPEFMSREEPTSVPVREKEPVTHEVAVTAIKQARQPPGYEVEFPYAPDLTYKKPHVEALERDKTQPLQVSKPELAEHAKSLQAVRPLGVLYVEPPSYEQEYLYVPEFMATQRTTSAPVKGKETMGMEAAVPTEQQVTSPAGYDVDFPNAPDIISRRPHAERPVKEGTEKTEVFKFEVPEHAEVHAPSYEVKYKYTRRMMPHGNLSSVVVQRHVVKEGALQAVRPAGVLYVEPPSYELEYLYVPEFLAREEPTSVSVKEKQPVALETAVMDIKQARPPPGYEVDFPYAPDQSFRKPRVEDFERDKAQPLEVSKPEMAEYAKVQPPSYELEYRYIPDFMKPETSGAAISQAAQEGALQAVRPAGVVYVKPPPYELEYVYVPEMMASEGPTTALISEKEPITLEAAVSPTKQETSCGRTSKGEDTGLMKFPRQKVAEYAKAEQAVRPFGVLFVEPPPYELEYLYVPEFMTTEGTTSVPVKRKETMASEAAVPTVQQVTSPTGYDVDFPNAPDIISRRPHVEPPVKEGKEQTEVFKFEVPEHAEVHAPSYQMEYRYMRQIIRRGNLSSVVVQRRVVKEGVLQAVRPAGVLYVEPPSYELEYLYVPEFLAREEPTSVPVKEKEPVVQEAAVTVIKHARPPPGYEVDFPYAPDLTFRKPEAEALEREKTQLQLSKPEVAEYGKALQPLRPAGVLYVEPPSYELEYLYVPEFMNKDVPTTVLEIEKKPVTREAAAPAMKQLRPPPGYEVELTYAPDLDYLENS